MILSEEGVFKIVLKEKASGKTVKTFRVDAGFPSNGVIESEYSQTGCDGATDTFFAFYD